MSREMAAPMPKVTVIVVNYNGGALNEDFLRSLSAQHFRDFETIIIDNGSSDGSLPLLHECLGKFALT